MEQFTELAAAFSEEIRQGPLWVQIWVNWMALMMVLTIPFAFVRVEARWAVLAMLLIFPTMMFLYAQFGYQRILGLGHIPYWTPLLVYLLARRDKWRVKESIGGKWLALFTLTISISLLFDYADVIRYLIGERV